MPAYSTDTQGFDAASHSAVVGAIVELIQLDTTECFDAAGNRGQRQYFIDSHQSGTTVTFRGNEYAPWPLSTNGWEWTNGTPPRPTVTLADAQGILLNEARRFKMLVGARVTRILTSADLIPAGSGSSPEIYDVSRVTQADGTTIALELITSLELLNLKIPGRKALRKGPTPEESFPGLGLNRYRA